MLALNQMKAAMLFRRGWHDKQQALANAVTLNTETWR